MLNKCKVVECGKEKPRRNLLCKACWAKLPKDLQHPQAFRPAVKKPEVPQYTLRATPNKDWFEKAVKYVGKIRIPYIVGFGYSAVKMGDV